MVSFQVVYDMFQLILEDVQCLTSEADGELLKILKDPSQSWWGDRFRALVDSLKRLHTFKPISPTLRSLKFSRELKVVYSASMGLSSNHLQVLFAFSA